MVLGSWTLVPIVNWDRDDRMEKALLSSGMVVSDGADVVKLMIVVTTMVEIVVG